MDRPLIGLSLDRGTAEGPDRKSDLAFHRLNSGYSDSVYAAGGIPMALPPLSPKKRFLLDPKMSGFLDGKPLEKNLVHYGALSGFPYKEPYRHLAKLAVMRVSGLVLTGGADMAHHEKIEAGPMGIYSRDVARDVWEKALFEAALIKGIPVFGICRGIQLINAALGGTLHEDIPRDFPSPAEHSQPTSRAHASHKVRLDPNSLIAKILGREELEANSLHHQAVKDLGEGLIATGRAPDGLIEAVELKGKPFVLAVQWHPEGLLLSGGDSIALFSAFVKAAKELQAP
jgi:putative glutamine amidotransferase